MKTVDKNSANNNSKKNDKEVKTKKTYSQEKLKNLEQERQKRIKNEKISEKENQKIYEEILEEAKKNNFKTKIRKDDDSIELKTNIKISLCKNGLPTGNLFEYSAYVIKNYEKKWKEKKSKINKENIEKYWEQKEKDFKEKIEKNKNNLKEIKKLNRSLDEIEMKKYIKDLDRSRSSRGIKPLRKKIGEKEDNNKLIPSTFKKKNKSLNKSNNNNNPNKEKKQNENIKNYKKDSKNLNK